MFKQIKDVLLEDTTLILDILEDLDCHDIIDRKDEIRAALPEHSNNTSIRIKKNEYLSVDIFSRNDFNDFEITDIFALVQYVNKCSLSDATKYICGLTNIEFDGQYFEYAKSKTVREVKRFKPKKKNNNKHTILNESELDKYEKYVVDEWVKEGIDKETQALFDVRIDKKNERWLIPIRDAFGNLISIKGRTFVKDFKLKGIGKYIHYFKLGFNDILFGYNITAPYIFQKDEIIIVESEKSVMKAFAWGEKNFVASGTAGLNPYQIKNIIMMQCKRVVIAYDKDIGMDIIQKDINALKYYKEVYYIIDKEDILEEKDSPVDQGFFNWLTLYEKRKRGK